MSPQMRPGWLKAIAGLPRSFLKQFVVHFDIPKAGLTTPSGASFLPSLTLKEALALTRYRWSQWIFPPRAPSGSPNTASGALTGTPVRETPSFRPPSLWPSRLPLPKYPPPPHAEEVPEGLLRVQAIGHGSFLLQTSGLRGSPLRPLSIITDPFFSTHAGPWGRVGGSSKQQHAITASARSSNGNMAFGTLPEGGLLGDYIIPSSQPSIRRVSQPGVSISFLPSIDIVLLTSPSYDSMDMKTLKELQSAFSPVIIGPRGTVGPLYLPPKLRGSAYSLQWEDEPLKLGGAFFSLLPTAGGAPSRWGLDKGVGGWGAFCVLLGTHQVYVGGAQGYNPALLAAAAATAQQQRLAAALNEQEAAVREKYEALWGPLEADDPTPQAKEMATELAAARHRILAQQPQGQHEGVSKAPRDSPGIDLALLPIGGYEPTQLLQRFHMTPEEAVEAHRLLGCRATIASRFDVLPLGAEPFGEAPQRAAAACVERGVPFNPHAKTQGGPSSKADPGFYTLQPGEAIYV
ncbi:60s ribosomal protein [Cyclospora cayetanensis]|uniref:60s ribosomal protein n=1 Tax=Cyclospora cayetanensis TaxID=88456 RepID=A0A1D3CWF4_9EIME|nr:60s ribosomal protein [Cyclospora cayetanensis]